MYRKCYLAVSRIMEDRLLSFEEAQQLTGIRIPTWRKWAAKRRIAVVRIGRRVKVRRSDLERLIERNLIPAAPEGR